MIKYDNEMNPSNSQWKILLLVGIVVLSLSQSPSLYSAREPNSSSNVLILYDKSSNWDWVGYLSGLFLANLLGHFDVSYTLSLIETYTAGRLNQYNVIFYLGTQYNNQLPEFFIQDVLHTTRTIVWFRYNLWQLIQAQPNFSSQYGFTFDGLDTSSYDQIIYKNTVLTKNPLDAELCHITINEPTLVSVPAKARQASTGNTIPYIIHTKHFWYVADIPFTLISENDRYLAFADLLFDILQVNVKEQKRALLRLEDIDPNYNPTILRQTADYLYSQHVPFAIAVIPYYRDPLSYYQGHRPVALKMTDNPDFIAALKYMESKGGTIILHGYTHQYSNVLNAYTGVSGHDYEFFRVTENPDKTITTGPVSEDSSAWVEERINSALALLTESGLTTSIWETPHYAASYIDNQYFAKKFPATIGRVLYFDKNNSQHHALQFYPYVIRKDSYGQKIIPENIGCISPAVWFDSPSRTVNDLVITAKKNLVVRDAWASMYYHPYIGLSYLQELIPAIRELGYEFVPVTPDLY